MRRASAVAVIGFLVLLLVRTADADPPTLSIYEIQHSDAASDWKSPYDSTVVNCVGGIVTHVFKQRLALQDPGLGTEWAAVEVRGWPVYPTGIEVGDQVDFYSVYVEEFAGVTTLKYYSASSHVVNSGGNPLPDPVPVSPWSIRYPAHPEDCEKYAAMLIEIDETVTIGAMDLGKESDNYEIIGVSGDTAWASDYANNDIDSTYCVYQGECYGRLVGILQRYDDDVTWDYYQFLPRGIGDYTPCSGGVELDDVITARGWFVRRPHPNPFNPDTSVPFRVSAAGRVTVTVYDLMGRKVTDLVDDVLGPGLHHVRWNGRDSSGRPMPSAVYFIRLSAEGQIETSKVCLVR